MKEINGYVEITDEGQLEIGRLGLKVYRNKQKIKDEGFHNDNIGYVEVKLLTPKTKG